MRLRVRAPSLGTARRCGWPTRWSSGRSSAIGSAGCSACACANQNTILVNLPAIAAAGRGDDRSRSSTAAGSSRRRPNARRVAARAAHAQDPSAARTSRIRCSRGRSASFLYSNRSYWYPQAPVTDYATATIRITRAGRTTAASPAASRRPARRGRSSPAATRRRPRKVYMFTAERPLRYLAFVVSRFARADRWTVAFDANAARSSSSRADAPDRAAPSTTSST